MTTKEMVPVVKRVDKSTLYLCKPEWNLLCRVRSIVLSLISISPMVNQTKKIKKILRGIIAEMDAEFDNWPEDPK